MMSVEDKGHFERMCRVHGFAPSRALRDMVDGLLGLERLEIAQIVKRTLLGPGCVSDLQRAQGEAILRALHARGDPLERVVAAPIETPERAHPGSTPHGY